MSPNEQFRGEHPAPHPLRKAPRGVDRSSQQSCSPTAGQSGKGGGRGGGTLCVLPASRLQAEVRRVIHTHRQCPGGQRGTFAAPRLTPCRGAGAWLLGGLWLRRGLVGVRRREPLGRGRAWPSRRGANGARPPRAGQAPGRLWSLDMRAVPSCAGPSGRLCGKGAGPAAGSLSNGAWPGSPVRGPGREEGAAASPGLTSSGAVGAPGHPGHPLPAGGATPRALPGRRRPQSGPWAQPGSLFPRRNAGAAGPAGRRRQEPGVSLPSGEEARPRCLRRPLASRPRARAGHFLTSLSKRIKG
ncbi:collagen alpha-2(I) chain-like [Bos javanicus]|uniref:collagen alpha-2(I) chain-like n=1 Tax=Bos javanicus TaxID=9906 RepID=UPI002AA7E3D3|nr:collagen alpha-2(I) chain-like [Bos javanicus]